MTIEDIAWHSGNLTRITHEPARDTSITKAGLVQGQPSERDRLAPPGPTGSPPRLARLVPVYLV